MRTRRVGVGFELSFRYLGLDVPGDLVTSDSIFHSDNFVFFEQQKKNTIIKKKLTNFISTKNFFSRILIQLGSNIFLKGKLKTLHFFLIL